MPKYSNIRWRDSDTKELNRVIKNFNGKIARAIKANPDMSDLLPSKVRAKDIRANIKTRRDLNFELSMLKAFSKRNALDIVDIKGGARTIRWEYDQSKRMLKRINARKAQARKEADVSTEKGTMGSILRNNLQDKQFLGNTGQQSWDSFVKSLRKQMTDKYWSGSEERYKENYLKALDGILGEANSPYYKAIRDIVNNLSATDLIQAQYDNPVLEINFIYPDTDQIRLNYEIAYPVYQSWLFWISQNNKDGAIKKYWKQNPLSDDYDDIDYFDNGLD